MIAWLESLPTWVAGVVVVGGFVLSTMVMGLIVQRFAPGDVRATHNDRAGFILAVIGVVYAVLLAFVAIGTWERFENAQERAYEGATALSTVYRDAASFPRPQRLRGMLRDYAREVAFGEWPRMRRGEPPAIVNPLLETVAADVRGLPVPSMRLAAVHTEMLAALETVIADRETRLTIDFIGINDIIWVVLITGAYITVAFTYLFGFERTSMQQLMIFGLSLMIGLVLFLVLALDYPFRGSIAVDPDAFTALIRQWGS